MGREGADADAPWAWVLMGLEHLAVVDAIGDEVHPDFHWLGSTLYVGSPAPVPGLGRPLGNDPTEAFRSSRFLRLRPGRDQVGFGRDPETGRLGASAPPSRRRHGRARDALRRSLRPALRPQGSLAASNRRARSWPSQLPHHGDHAAPRRDPVRRFGEAGPMRTATHLGDLQRRLDPRGRQARVPTGDPRVSPDPGEPGGRQPQGREVRLTPSLSRLRSVGPIQASAARSRWISVPAEAWHGDSVTRSDVNAS